MKTVKAICSSNSVLRKFIMNLFVRELIVMVVIAVQCVSCFALPRTEPQVDSNFCARSCVQGMTIVSQGLLNSVVRRRVR